MSGDKEFEFGLGDGRRIVGVIERPLSILYTDTAVFIGLAGVVIVMAPRRPPKRRMLTWSPMACMTEPAPRKSWALKKPWVSRWKIANA